MSITPYGIQRFLNAQPADEIGDRYCQITPDGELLPYTEPPAYPVLTQWHTGFRGVDDLIAALDPDVDAAVTEWQRQAKPAYVDRDPFGTRAAIAARNATAAPVPGTAKCVCIWSVRPVKRGGVVSWHATLTVTVPGTGSVARATESRIKPTEYDAIHSLQAGGVWQTLAAFGITPERVP